MDADQFRSAAHAAIEHIISYFQSLPKQRVTAAVSPGYLRPLLPASAPQEPEAWDRLLNDVSTKIQPGLTHWMSPNFFAFFPASTTYPSILGELFSATFNAPAFNWLCSPACTELETVVLDWVAEALGLPQVFSSRGEGGGVIQGSASEAIVVAMVAARERYVRNTLEQEGLLPETPDESDERKLQREDRAAEIRSKLVALGSDQAHSATQKAANILGARYRGVKATYETGFRVTGANLQAKLEEVERAGLVPFYFTATLGTTGTCAVDDLDAIASIRQQRPHLWVHVDAAYAGAALICPELRSAARAEYLGEFDSFDFNMHKWMLTGFDASCMFVRKRADLINALAITPSYLVNPDSLSGQQVTDYRDWQIPLGRRFRSLKIWFVLRSYGIRGIQEILRKHVGYGELFAELCKSSEGRAAGIRIVTGPAFALTVIRCVGPGAAGGTDAKGESNPAAEMNGFGCKSVSEEADGPVTPESNALTKRVAERINSEGTFFVTPSVLDGMATIRVVGGNPNITEEGVRGVYGAIVEALKSV